MTGYTREPRASAEGDRRFMQSKVLFGLAAATALFGACSSDGEDPPASMGGASGSAGAGGKAGEATAGKAGEATAGRGGSAGASPVGGSAHGGMLAGGAGGTDEPSAGAGGSPEGGVPGDGGASSGGAGDGGDGGGDAAPSVAYVSNVFGQLHVARLDVKSGAPVPFEDSPIAVDDILNAMVPAPSGKFLFVAAEPSRIDTFPIAADGSLPEAPSASVELDEDDPLLSIAMDPLGRFVYGVSPQSKLIYVFDVDADSGELTQAGDPLLVGAAPDHRRPAFVAADPSGKFVYITQLADAAPIEDNGLRGYRVNAETGALTELADSPFAAGNDAGGAIVFRPDGKFLFSSGAALNAFAVDADSGKLTKVTGSPFSTDIGSDPWATNITIDPRGKRLFTCNFFGVSQHIRGFAIDAVSGALSELPGSPVTSTAPYSLALGPSGRTLYIGNDIGTVSAFNVAKNGALELLDDSPFDLGGLEPDFAFVTLP